MFGKKEEYSLDIPVLTIDHYPNRNYEVLGTVTARIIDPKIIKQADLNKVIPKLQESANEINADAVIGTRMSMLNAVMMYSYGTAIKFTD